MRLSIRNGFSLTHLLKSPKQTLQDLSCEASIVRESYLCCGTSDSSRVARPPTSFSPRSAWRLRISRISLSKTGQGWSQRNGTIYQSRTKRFISSSLPRLSHPKHSLMSHTHLLEIPRSSCARWPTFQTRKEGSVWCWTFEFNDDPEGEGGCYFIITL